MPIRCKYHGCFCHKNNLNKIFLGGDEIEALSQTNENLPSGNYSTEYAFKERGDFTAHVVIGEKIAGR